MTSKPTYEELKQRIQALEKELSCYKSHNSSVQFNRQHLEAILNSTNLCIYLKNIDYKYIFMNR
jgi:hypothetical protein